MSVGRQCGEIVGLLVFGQIRLAGRLQRSRSALIFIGY